MKKKLLIATDNFIPRWDGIVRFLLEIFPKLQNEFDITILAPNFGKREFPLRFPGIKLILFPTHDFMVGDFPPARITRHLRRAIRKEVHETDILWMQTIGPIGFYASRAAKKEQKPVVAQIHSLEWELVSEAVKLPKLLSFLKPLLRGIVRAYARKKYNSCDKLIVPYRRLKEGLELIGITAEKEVIRLGVNTEKFAPPADKLNAKLKLGIDARQKTITYCGRIGKEKNVDMLVEAFKKVRQRFPDALLFIIGDGPEKDVQKLKAVKNVVVTGFVDDVVPYLQASDVFVMPSFTETTSLATLEAMACGVPVIVTRVGFMQRYVRRNYNGLFAPKKNPSLLALKLIRLLENRRLRETLGANARHTVVKAFSWERTAHRIREVLRGVE